MFAIVLSWSPNQSAAIFVGMLKTNGWVQAASICPKRTIWNFVPFEHKYTPKTLIIAPKALTVQPTIAYKQYIYIQNYKWDY